MILNTEIASVEQVPVKPYSGKFGDTWFIDGRFKDGSFFSRGAKSVEGAEKLRATLLGLVGQPQAFVVEDTNREYQGNKKWTLKEVPGQSQGNYAYKSGGSSGSAGRSFAGSGGASSYRYSEQGTREERDSIIRQVALKCAAEIGAVQKSPSTEGIIAAAETFYAWLSKKPTEPEVPPYERYSNEINKALKQRDTARLDALTAMIKQSLSKGTLNIDQVAALDDELIDARKALNSAAVQDEWYKRSQEKARQTEPLHESPAIASTLEQAQEAF